MGWRWRERTAQVLDGHLFSVFPSLRNGSQLDALKTQTVVWTNCQILQYRCETGLEINYNLCISIHFLFGFPRIGKTKLNSFGFF